MIRKLLSCIGLLMLIVVAIAGLIGWQSYKSWLQAPSKDAESVTYTVNEGSGFSLIAKDLKEQGLISNKTWFRIYTIIDGSASDLQAGIFELQTGMSYSAIVDRLINAESEEVSITIPEGYILDQIGEEVTSNFNISTAEWEAAVGPSSMLNDHELVVLAKKPAGVDLEGYLFPDTYRFFVDATAEDIVETMLDTMLTRMKNQGVLDVELRAEVSSLHGLLTFASILEREVRTTNDLPHVSDIIYKRLNIGMALQMDSTVNYFTGKDTPSISLSDRDREHPYNTYQNVGLPPGPISNPGIDAIKAAVSPTSNEYFYFLTTEEGEVIYAVTHDQHVQNKNTYLR